MLLERFRKSVIGHQAMHHAYQHVFASPEGKIVLHDLLRTAGLLETSMVAGDAHATAYREGRRSVGLELVHKLRWTEGEMIALAMQRTAEQLTTTTEDQ